jgi:hypothetical protein
MLLVVIMVETLEQKRISRAETLIAYFRYCSSTYVIATFIPYSTPQFQLLFNEAKLFLDDIFCHQLSRITLV